jgi:hypothetical protein
LPLQRSNKKEAAMTHFKLAALALGATLTLGACGTNHPINENTVSWHKPGVSQAQANLDEQQCRQQADIAANSAGQANTANTRIIEYKNCISARGYRPGGELARNDHIGFFEF